MKRILEELNHDRQRRQNRRHWTTAAIVRH